MDALIDEYMQLREEKNRIEESLKPINNRLGEVEREIVESFQQSGTQSVKRNGKLVYLNRDLVVRVTDKEALAGYFIEAEQRDLLSVNTATLKSYCKQLLFNAELNEWEATPLKIPAELRDAIEVSERHFLGFRKG